ncbi:MAG: D-alanyl-D-alanine carboxypeptidase [Clostridiales bacterium]|nr:D-alanyl-D-alanine carboxypeptidase [Clostridiales bacterium]
MKKTIIFIFCLLILLPSFAVSGVDAAYNYALEENYCEISLLASVDTGAVIFDKNSHMRAAPASLTKIVTASLALEKCPNLDTPVVVPASAITALNGTGSSMAGLKAEETVPMRELLYCLLVKSANEAANVIADYIGGGSIDAFVAMMNEYAVATGCTETHFVNAHGLDDPDHYTTAYDMFLLAKRAIENATFCEIVAKYGHTMPATDKSDVRYLYNTNGMLNSYSEYYYEYAKGIKTGTTPEAGSCLLSLARKDGYSYIAVAMKGTNTDTDGDGQLENVAMLACRDMFKWAFANLKLKTVTQTTDPVAVVNVELAKDVDHVRIVPAQEIVALVPKSTERGGLLIEVIPEQTVLSVEAPVTKGQVLGKARVLYAGEELATVDLISAEDIQRNPVAAALAGIKKVLTSTAFKIIAAIFVLALAAFVVIWYLTYQKMKKKRNKIHVVKNYRDINK